MIKEKLTILHIFIIMISTKQMYGLEFRLNMPSYLCSFAVSSDRGLKRENNEDNFYLDGVYMPPGDSNEHASFAGGPSFSGVLAVFDGLGGESFGEIASYEAASVLDKYRKQFLSEKNVGAIYTIADSYISEANAFILKKSSELHSRMGTTLALLIFNEGKVYALNMGDSRIYLLRGGSLERLSYDHTLAEFLVARGDITRTEAKTDPRRNSLLKYLGGEVCDHDFKPYTAPVAQAETGDKFLLCSDGLTDMVSEKGIKDILTASKSASIAAEALIAAAIKAGGNDNITALCVFIN
jgi:protein phosphatase